MTTLLAAASLRGYIHRKRSPSPRLTSDPLDALSGVHRCRAVCLRGQREQPEESLRTEVQWGGGWSWPFAACRTREEDIRAYNTLFLGRLSYASDSGIARAVVKTVSTRRARALQRTGTSGDVTHRDAQRTTLRTHCGCNAGEQGAPLVDARAERPPRRVAGHSRTLAHGTARGDRSECIAAPFRRRAIVFPSCIRARVVRSIARAADISVICSTGWHRLRLGGATTAEHVERSRRRNPRVRRAGNGSAEVTIVGSSPSSGY